MKIGLAERFTSLLGSPHPDSLRSQIALGVSGNLALRVSSVLLAFLTTLLLARFLGAGAFGDYAFALAWATFLYVPAMMGFDRLLVREVAIANQHANWSVFSGVVRWTTAVSFLISLSIAAILIAVPILLSHEGNQSRMAATAVASGLVPIMALTGLRRAILQGLSRVVLSQVPESLIRPVLLIAAILGLQFAFPAYLTGAVAIGANLFAAAAAFIVGSFFLFTTLPSLVRSAQPQYLSQTWLASAWPLVMLGVLQAANTQLSTLVLGLYHPSETVGIYTVALRVSALASFFLMSFNTVLAPRFAALYSRGKREQLQRLVTKSSLIICLLSLPIPILLIVFGKPFLTIFGPEYVEAYDALVILSIGVLFNSTMGPVGILLTMTGHERDAARGIGLSLVVNIGLNFALIPRYGAEGAALSSAVYLFLWNILFAVYVFRRTGIIPSIVNKLPRFG